jgi:hypothetical protein
MSDIASPAVESDHNKPAFPAFASAVVCHATTFGSAAFTTDISARRRADRALRNRQVLLASRREDLPPGVGISNRHGNLDHLSQPLHDHVQRG